MYDQKNVRVYHAIYEAHDPIATTQIELGKISSADAERIMETFASASPQYNACIKTLSLKYTDDVYFGNLPSFTLRYRALELTNQWGWQQTPLQCIGRIPKNSSKKNCLEICAHHLCTGKCRDAFIRSTLGVALFPQLYSKDKQK